MPTFSDESNRSRIAIETAALPAALPRFAPTAGDESDCQICDTVVELQLSSRHEIKAWTSVFVASSDKERAKRPK